LDNKAKQQELFFCACRACAGKLHLTEGITREGLPLIGEMSEHPVMSQYIEQGYTILTF
jgi:hypothetical protein